MDKLKSLIKILLIVVFVALLYVFYFIIKDVFSSQEEFALYIESYGIWAPLVFLIIQILQVIVAPIPGNFTTIAGGYIFGWVKGFLLGQLGITLGSVVMFLFAKKYGYRSVSKFLDDEKYEKYIRLLSNKSRIVILCIFLMPFFPDDILCLIAGLTSLSFIEFVIIVLIGRSPGTLIAALTGSGAIHLTIKHFVLIGCISLFTIILYVRYQERLEQFINKKFSEK